MALFRTFSHFFRIFPPGLFPSKQGVLAQSEQKRRTNNKKNWTNRCCTLVVARLSSSYKLFVAENGPFGTPFFDPKIPPKKFMWVPFLRPFPGNEAHTFFLGDFHEGVWVGAKKFMCFFGPLFFQNVSAPLVHMMSWKDKQIIRTSDFFAHKHGRGEPVLVRHSPPNFASLFWMFLIFLFAGGGREETLETTKIDLKWPLRFRPEKLVCLWLRWAKSSENYRRIASENYRSNENH